MNSKRLRRGLMALLAVVMMPLTLATPATASAAKTWTAFGDSVASGYGNPAVDNATPTDLLCARSKVAHPVLAAADKGATLLNLPCSGAGTWHGMLGSQVIKAPDGTVLGTVPSQLVQAAKGPRPYYASLTVGSNDLDWGGQLQKCTQHACATPENTAAAQALERDVMRPGLVASVTGIALLCPHEVLVTQYYDPFGGSDAVAAAFGLGPAEIAWYRARLAEVNAIIADAVHSVARFFPQVTFKVVPLVLNPAQIFLNPALPGLFHPNQGGQAQIEHDVVLAA